MQQHAPAVLKQAAPAGKKAPAEVPLTDEQMLALPISAWGAALIVCKKFDEKKRAFHEERRLHDEESWDAREASEKAAKAEEAYYEALDVYFECGGIEFTNA
jgi:hypothetical protein